MFQLLLQTFFKIFWVCRCTLLLSNSSCYWQFLKPGVNKIFESVTYKFVVESENNRYTFQGCAIRKLKGTQCSELEKSRVLSAWFFWKNRDFLVGQEQKLGTSGNHALLEHSLLVKLYTVEPSYFEVPSEMWQSLKKRGFEITVEA